MTEALVNTTRLQRSAGWLQPHRIVLITIAVAIVLACAFLLRWDWVPKYMPLALQGIWRTIWLLAVSTALGLALAAIAKRLWPAP